MKKGYGRSYGYKEKNKEFEDLERVKAFKILIQLEELRRENEKQKNENLNTITRNYLEDLKLKLEYIKYGYKEGLKVKK